ncbi:MAG: PAS domain S-box protein [Desulfosarcina sp.]|nr:PAS domain S-box protein [Desulfobacterales bacterium]
MTIKPTDKERHARFRQLELRNRDLEQELHGLRHSEARFRTLYMTGPGGMYEIDFETGRFTSVNNYVLDHSGYSREEFMRLNPTDLLTDASRAHFYQRFEKILAGQSVPTNVEFQLKLKDGGKIWALCQIRYVYRKGTISGASVTIYNIDERKRAEVALKNSEKRFRTLVETMTEGLAMTDAQGQIIYINRKLEEMSGYRADELVGRNVWDIIDPQSLSPVEDILAGRSRGEGQSYELSWTGKKGRRNFSILSPQTLFDESDRFYGTFAVVTDITEQKNSERALSARGKELQQKNEHLEEINTALQTLVKIREQDKTEIEETIVDNIRQLVDPVLERLKSSGLSERQRSYVAILKANLKEIITPFSKQIVTLYLELTPAEVEVANLVKHSRKSKEIASLLNISTRTVEMHRRNIRKKFGLRHKHANLRTFLLSK